MNHQQREERDWPTDELLFLLAIVAPILITLYLIFSFDA
jgi:hypothetical protein